MHFDTIKKLKDRFTDRIEVHEKRANRIYVNVPDKRVALDVVKFLFLDCSLRFSIASGVDRRDGIEILYHMSDDVAGAKISVRTLAEKPHPCLPSATGFLPGAEWIEREIHELLGVDFTGHPNLKRLLLPDDWTEGRYPLRKGQL